LMIGESVIRIHHVHAPSFLCFILCECPQKRERSGSFEQGRSSDNTLQGPIFLFFLQRFDLESRMHSSYLQFLQLVFHLLERLLVFQLLEP